MNKPIVKTGNEEASSLLAQRLGEVLLFTGVILLSCLAVIAVALAAPFVLAASVIAGLFSNGAAPRGWRSAGA